MRPGRLAVAGAALALAVAGVLGLVYLVAGAELYRGLADPAGAVVLVDGAPRRLDRETLVRVHEATLDYLLGAASALPDAPGGRTPLFDADERSHMADVRTVFGGVRVLLALALVALAAQLLRAARRGRVYLARLVRRAGIAAAAGVALVGVVAGVAFEPLFLAFHLVFFPQGNFLFPAGSNLLAVYPEPYWYGVTLSLGALFVGLDALLVAAASASLARASVHSPR